MSFVIGQKVCFDPNAKIIRPPVVRILPWPAEITPSRIFTIRDIDARYIPVIGVPGLRFDEFVSPLVDYMGSPFEPAFGADRFRPVVERKTDISIFTRMLTPTPAKVN